MKVNKLKSELARIYILSWSKYQFLSGVKNTVDLWLMRRRRNQLLEEDVKKKKKEEEEGKQKGGGEEAELEEK